MEKPALLFSLVLCFKGLLSLFFSSGYVDELFIPFVGEFAEQLAIGNLINPYATFLIEQKDAFPYHPLMLYILTAFYLPITFFSENIYFQRLFLALPSLIADALIAFLLIKFSRGRVRAVLFSYFASPIILFAVYMHGQLDLLPTATCFLAYYLLTIQKFRFAGLAFGAALSMKLHVAVLLPMILVYLFRKEPLTRLISFLYSMFFIFLVISGPWYLSPAFREMVLFNEKQSLIFEATFAVGNNKIYLAIFAVLVLYARFIGYSQYNRSLFILYSTMLLASFVIFVPPAPGWYLWFLPFLIYFYLRNIPSKTHIVVLGGILNISYVVFFLTVWEGDYTVLTFMNEPLSLLVPSEKYQDTVFTFMQAVLTANLFAIYRYGVKENKVYKKPGGLLIGIGGDSGAGKSTLLHSLKDLLKPSVTVLEGDGDHRWERGNKNWEKVTHLDPKGNYLQRQAENLYLLKKGTAIRRPDYNHETGLFTEPQVVKPADYILLSGLHAFFLPKLRKVTDIKVFLDPHESLRMHWKILRDTSKRGYNKEMIMKQIEARKKDADSFISPQRAFADLVIEYFPLSQFKVGDSTASVKFGLKLIVNSNVHLEHLILNLQDNGILDNWDYLPDTERQYMVLQRPPESNELEKLRLELFFDTEDLFSPRSEWHEGYSGLIQLVVSLMIQQSFNDGTGGDVAI